MGSILQLYASKIYHPFPSSPSFQQTRISAKTQFHFPSKQTRKNTFLGEKLIYHYNKPGLNNHRKGHRFPTITAAVKRRKEISFDNVIQRDKKLILALKIRKILVSQPDRVMSIRNLGRFRKNLGIVPQRKIINLLKRYPAVFEIVDDEYFSLKFKLTHEAEQLYLEELKVKTEIEELLVQKLRKLLMMSLEKRIPLAKIIYIAPDLGLPVDFRDTICPKYPQYFKIVDTDEGPILELTSWDSNLAVSTFQISEKESLGRITEEKQLIIDRPLKFNRFKSPKGLKLSKGEMRKINEFREIPYISPYSDFRQLKAGTTEKEKHACGVVHEILSLTVEKRTFLDYITHFREEFKFSHQFKEMLIRHPDMFYVSLKGEKNSVFLREAYCNSRLIEKNPLLSLKEKLQSLVAISRFSRKLFPQSGLAHEDNHGQVNEKKKCNDIDSSDFDHRDEISDFEDDWFEDIRGINILSEIEGKILDPVYPDGTPRECW